MVAHMPADSPGRTLSRASAPLVSVVIPMHNSRSHILETVNSVLNQSHENLEILAVDDASSDDTLDLLDKIDDPRLKIIPLDTNAGAGNARNKGIDAVSGEFLALLDSDDRWYPDKIEKQLRFMQSSGAKMCYTRYDLIDSEGSKIGASGPLAASVTYEELLRHCIIRTSSLMVDLGALSKPVYFPLIRKRQDFVFFLRLLKVLGEARLLDEVTSSYRIHSGTVSSNKFKVIPFQWNVYRTQEQLPLAKSLQLMGGWFFNAGFVNARRVMQWLRSR